MCGLSVCVSLCLHPFCLFVSISSALHTSLMCSPHQHVLQSDVWSFGITLWEAFSGGQRPYAGMKGTEVLEFLKMGRRLTPPPSCPKVLLCFFAFVCLRVLSALTWCVACAGVGGDHGRVLDGPARTALVVCRHCCRFQIEFSRVVGFLACILINQSSFLFFSIHGQNRKNCCLEHIYICLKHRCWTGRLLANGGTKWILMAHLARRCAQMRPFRM